MLTSWQDAVLLLLTCSGFVLFAAVGLFLLVHTPRTPRSRWHGACLAGGMVLGSQVAGGSALISVVQNGPFFGDTIMSACLLGALFGAGFGNVVGLLTRNRFSNRPDDPAA